MGLFNHLEAAFRPKDEAESQKIHERRAEIKALLAEKKVIRKRLQKTLWFDREKLVHNSLSPKEALDLAERQLKACLKELRPGGRGYDYANPGNAESWMRSAESAMVDWLINQSDQRRGL